MPLIMLGVPLIHGSLGRGSLLFSPSSVIGNLVTALNFKFWHSCGAAIHLLARQTAQGFSRNPLIVLNTNNIYAHWDETKFTASFWGWLQDAVILTSMLSPAFLPESSQTALQPGHHWLPPRSSLLFSELVLQQISHLSFLSPLPFFEVEKGDAPPFFYSPRLFRMYLCSIPSYNIKWSL